MNSTHYFDRLKSQLSFSEGINKIHYVVLVVIIALILLFFPGEKQITIAIDDSTKITPIVLKAIYEQNIDKRLEYAESKPIIDSMKKYLEQFDALKHRYPEKAKAPLLIVMRRLFYLKNKGLDVSDAEQILDEVIKIKKLD